MAGALICGKPADFVYQNHGVAIDWAMCRACRDRLVADIEAHHCGQHAAAAISQIAPLH